MLDFCLRRTHHFNGNREMAKHLDDQAITRSGGKAVSMTVSGNRDDVQLKCSGALQKSAANDVAAKKSTNATTTAAAATGHDDGSAGTRNQRIAIGP